MKPVKKKIMKDKKKKELKGEKKMKTTDDGVLL